MTNALNVIFPYKYEGMWVFDDADAGLDKEPFVEGADVIIDRALEAKGVTNADAGFRLLFSAGEFPRYDVKFTWLRAADGGNYYAAEGSNLEGGSVRLSSSTLTRLRGRSMRDSRKSRVTM